MATPKWTPNGLKYIANGSVDLDTDTMKLMLVTSSWTPNQSTLAFRSDVSSFEASGGSGYPAGGFTLASLSIAVASLTMKWDAADISQAITGGPLAFRYGVYYKARGGAASADEAVGFVDWGAQSVTDATINITNADQLQITAS